MNEVVYCAGLFCELWGECERFAAHLHNRNGKNGKHIDSAECIKGKYDYYYPNKQKDK